MPTAAKRRTVDEVAEELAKRLLRRLDSKTSVWLDIHQVAQEVRLSRSKIDQLKRDGLFPKPAAWNGAKQVWRKAQIEEWKQRVESGEVQL